jgi:hypothetical protein
VTSAGDGRARRTRARRSERLDPLPAQDLAQIDAVMLAADAEASQRLQSWSWLDLANLETRTPAPKS